MPRIMAPFSRRSAMSGESFFGTSIAKLTSLPPVDRMSFASYQFFRENATQYIGSFSRSGLTPYCRSSSAARSSASGSLRYSSHATGQEAGSGPFEGWVSHVCLQLTDRSPRMLSVSSAFSCPAFGMPTRIPNCCCTVGSEIVGSMRPNSSGGPLYCSKSGRIVEAAMVVVGYRTGAPARTAPSAGGMGAPSFVTSAVHMPL